MCPKCNEREGIPFLEGLCRLCDMFQSQTPPQSRSDREFLMGSANGSQFEKNPAMGDYYAKKAKKAGVSLAGKVYKHSLARYAGDPRAWVSDRGDVKRICEQEGWGCNGAVQNKLREQEPPKPVDIAPHLLKKYVKQELKKEGGPVTPRRLEDVTERVKNKIKRGSKKRGA